MLNWIAIHSGALSALSSLILTGITAYYALLTRRLLKESQEVRLAGARPEIAVYAHPYEGAINFLILHIENIGRGPAYDVRFTTNFDFKNQDHVPLSQLGLFSRGLAFLPPGRKIEHYLANIIGELDELKARPLEVVARYRDALERDHERSFVIDFAELENLGRIGTPPPYEIAETLKRMQHDLHLVVTGFSAPRILTQSVKEHNRRLAADELTTRIEELSEEDLSEVSNLLDKLEGPKASPEQRELVTKEEAKNPLDEGSRPKKPRASHSSRRSRG